MALCSVADVRAHINPVSLTDADITAIIASASEEVAARAGCSTSSTNPNAKLAGIHLAAAMTMKRARSGGELAAGVNTGTYQQQNTGLIDEMKAHEEKAEMFIKKYMMSSFGGLPTGRMGVGTVNN